MTTPEVLTVYENNYIINQIWLFLCAAMIFQMQIGFALYESGSVRQKNSQATFMKNLIDTLIGLLAFWILGFALTYGTHEFYFFALDPKKCFLLELNELNALKFLVAFMFANTCSTIVSGCLVERCHVISYAIFTFLQTLLFYPL